MGAFAGVRVLDCARERQGSLAAMMLADYGADVVKTIAPSMADPADAIMWGRNKRLLPLDLTTKPDRARLRSLLRKADVAIFDDGPGALRAWGWTAEECIALNPRLIHAWLPPYGVAGEESDLPPSPLLLNGMTGTAFRQGSYGDQPVHLVAPLLSTGQGIVGAGAIAAALVARARDGAGRAVVYSGLDANAQMNGSTRDVGTAPMVSVRPPGGSPNYRLYECGDGKWLFLGSLFEPFISRARQVLGIGQSSGDLQIEEQRYLSAFKTKPREAWIELFLASGTPVARVGENGPWFRSEPVAANDMRVVMGHETLGDVALPGVSAKLSSHPGALRSLMTVCEDAGWRARKTPPAGQQDGLAPLSGVRVLDMGVVIAGASTGAILSSFGADVIKVEPPEGDPFRSSGLVSASYNRGKRGLCIDIKTSSGKEAFLELAQRADVVLDNFRLGVRERLGIDAATLQALNPRLISCSITAYGNAGERAAWPGFDPLLQAESGLCQRQGGHGQEPVYHQIPVNDVASAAVASFGILAALHARLLSGRGQTVFTSLASQSVLYQARSVIEFDGAPRHEDGDRDCVGPTALCRYYACADGWIGIDCRKDAHLKALARALGLTALASPHPEAFRASRHGPLAAALESRFATLQRAEALEALRREGASAAAALRPIETYDDAFLAANRYFTRYQHAELGELLAVDAYGSIGTHRCQFQRPNPMLGEHSLEILREAGFAEARLDEMRQSGAVR